MNSLKKMSLNMMIGSKYKIKMKVLLLFLIIISCNSTAQNCKSLPEHFKSYQEAISLVKNSKFEIVETVNTSKSLWIQSAYYYSCNRVTGYFILKAHGKEYIHQDMPLDVWKNFKNASSFGSYYDAHIKHKYQLYLN